MDDQLVGPELPGELSYLWETFLHMANRRSSSGFGPNRITDQDILAYFTLRQCWLELWELDAIYKLDDVYMEVFNSNKGSS